MTDPTLSLPSSAQLDLLEIEINHHVIEDSYSAIYRAVLERRGGIDTAA